MLRQARFMICCAGVFSVYAIHQGGWFYLAAITAFGNLFSAQFMCSTQGCDRPHAADGGMRRDPVALIHYGTTGMGALFCLAPWMA